MPDAVEEIVLHRIQQNLKMETYQLLETVAQYLRDELSPEQRYQFEHLRKTNPELDQLVVEQSMFLQQLGQFSDWKNYKNQLQEIHHNLVNTGAIREEAPKALTIQLWKKYKRVMAVAASIAGVTTLLIAITVSYITRQESQAQLQQLRLEFKKEVDSKKRELLNEVDRKIKTSKAPGNSTPKSGGTGFLVDGKGYLITNAHVVDNANTVIVLNNKGDEFRARIVSTDPAADIALLKIDDPDYKTLTGIPYGIRRKGADLGESLFTLGYPRNEIVYNEGYMSARTGFNGDTMTCQIGVPANPGNSGGPVFNQNGEIVGIINTRLLQAEGVVFAITAKNILKAVEGIKLSHPEEKTLKLPSNTALRGMERTQQIRKIQDYVYMVKSY